MTMIRINLLPPERRKPERTPLPRFLLILIGAGLATGIVVYLVLLGIKIGLETRDLNQQDQQVKDLQKATTRFAGLDKEYKDIEAKKKTIDGLAKRDVVWSEILDALWTVINAHPAVWVSEISALNETKTKSYTKEISTSGGKGKEQAPPYGLRIKLTMYGDNVKAMTRLRSDLIKDPFLSKCLPLINRHPIYVRGVDENGVITTAFDVVMLALPPAPPEPVAKKKP